MAKLETAYPKDAESGAFPAYAPPEGEEPIDSAKGAVAIPAAVLAELTADDVLHLGTRRTIPPAYLMALKGALALVSDSEKFDASLTDATWDGVKEGVHMGDLLVGGGALRRVGGPRRHGRRRLGGRLGGRVRDGGGPRDGRRGERRGAEGFARCRCVAPPRQGGRRLAARDGRPVYGEEGEGGGGGGGGGRAGGGGGGPGVNGT